MIAVAMQSDMTKALTLADFHMRAGLPLIRDMKRTPKLIPAAIIVTISTASA